MSEEEKTIEEQTETIIDAIENPETHIPKQITVSGMLMEGEAVR